MRKQEIDYILGKMLDSNKNVSDLNITVGEVLPGGELGPADRRGDGSALPEADPLPDGDLRAEPDQPGPAADGDPAFPGVVRLLVRAPGQGPLPREHLLPAGELLHHPAKTGDPDPDLRRT